MELNTVLIWKFDVEKFPPNVICKLNISDKTFCGLNSSYVDFLESRRV